MGFAVGGVTFPVFWNYAVNRMEGGGGGLAILTSILLGEHCERKKIFLPLRVATFIKVLCIYLPFSSTDFYFSLFQGNPHSNNLSSRLTHDTIEHVRYR